MADIPAVPPNNALIAEAIEYLHGATMAGSLTWRRAAELLADWEHRAELTESEVQLVLCRFPDPDDYEEQVSRR